MKWATGDGVQAILNAAGVNHAPWNRQVRAFATAAAFAVGEEDVLLAILRPPRVPRTEVGPAELLVVTPTRAIQVTGPMRGDWSSSPAFRDSGPAGGISLVIRSLSSFTDFTFNADGWQFLAEEGDGPSSFVDGTTATFTGPGMAPLILWDPSDTDGSYPRSNPADRSGLLHRIAGGGLGAQSGGRQCEAS